MSETMKRILKNQVRLLEADLSNHTIELHNRMRAASETEQMVEFLKQQLMLVQAQLGQCDASQ